VKKLRKWGQITTRPTNKGTIANLASPLVFDINAPHNCEPTNQLPNQRLSMLISDSDAPLEKRWISIPQNIWDQPIISKEADWLFHNADFIGSVARGSWCLGHKLVAQKTVGSQRHRPRKAVCVGQPGSLLTLRRFNTEE
jgi:hypothetical protein